MVLTSNDALYKRKVRANQLVFPGNGGRASRVPGELEGCSISAKVRYAAPPAEAVLFSGEEGEAVALFKEPQRAPSPGQSIVYYQGDRLLGGGVIT